MKKITILLICLLSSQLIFAQCVENGNYWNESWVSCTTSANPNTIRGNTSHWIMYQFQESQYIDSTHIWNANRVGESGWGAKDVVIDYSTDGVTWIELGQFQFPQASENLDYEGFMGPQFNGVSVDKILLTILSTHDGGSCASLAELQFKIDPDACYGTIDACGICNGPGETTWYFDADMDGLGDPNISLDACTQPTGYVENMNDPCDNGELGWAEVGHLFSNNGCNGCHGASANGGLDLRTFGSTANGGNKCGTDLLTGTKLVDVINISGYDGCGASISLPSMNARVGNQFDAQELAMLQLWIDGGAPESCTDFCLSTEQEEMVSICENESYTFPDGSTQTNITSNVSHVSMLISVDGCDSTITTNIFVQPNYTLDLDFDICSGEDFTFPDGNTETNITVSFSYTSNLQTFSGCDSILITNINVNDTYLNVENISVCEGEDYTFPDGTTWTNILSNGRYISNFQSVVGCDSIIQSDLVVLPNYNQAINLTICSGDSYTYPDGSIQTDITADTVQTSIFNTFAGCDSLIFTSITIDENILISETFEICEGESFLFPDGTVQNNILNSQTYISTIETLGSCDSIITTNLNVEQNWMVNLTQQICEGSSFTFPDGTVITNVINDQTQTSLLLSTTGCDSSVITLLNVSNSYSINNSSEVCSGDSYTFPDGSIQNNITSDLMQSSSLTTIDGCDSLINTNLIVNNSYSEVESIDLCEGESYTFPDGIVITNITSDTSYWSNLQTSEGCDSLIQSEILVGTNYNISETVSLCSGSSYTFPDGMIQNNIISNLSYTSSLMSVSGCDSLIVTSISVDSDVLISESFDVCEGDSFTFPDGTIENNISINQSYNSTLVGVGDCDTIITTNLEVHPNWLINETEQVCVGGSFTFPDGTTVTNVIADQTYTSLLNSMQGCDSTVVTELKVTAAFMISVETDICQGASFTFPDGTVQDSVGMDISQISSLIATSGCDSIVTTNLTVLNNYMFDENINICQGESYIFPDGNSQSNIQSSLSYTSNLSTIAGCDSLIETNINVSSVDTTVVELGTTLTAASNADMYQWLDCENDYAVIPGATDQTYIAVEGGSYAVVLTQGTCSDTSSCRTVIVVGIEEIEQSLFSLRPNPVNGTLYLIGDFKEVPEVQVFNALGQLCMVKFNAGQKTMEVDHLSAGLYFLRFQVGQESVVLEFVKQ